MLIDIDERGRVEVEKEYFTDQPRVGPITSGPLPPFAELVFLPETKQHHFKLLGIRQARPQRQKASVVLWTLQTFS